MAQFLQWLLIVVCLVSVALSKPSKSKAGNKNGLKRQASISGDSFYCPGDTYSIPNSWICDGHSDCSDGSDEIACDSFYCPGETYSIPNAWICDGESDCSDGSDEIACGYDSSWTTWTGYDTSWSAWDDYYPTSTPNYDASNWSAWGSCSYGNVQCLDGACVVTDYVCDGYEDCTKGEDELFCPAYNSLVNDYKKQAGKRNLGKKIDDKVLRAKVYYELRNRHAKGEMKKGKQIKRVREGKFERTTEEDIKRLMENRNEKLKEMLGKKPSNTKIIK